MGVSPATNGKDQALNNYLNYNSWSAS